MIVNAHKPQLDEMTPAEIRVICEQLLYTMDIEQRIKFRETYPGLYAKIEPPKIGKGIASKGGRIGHREVSCKQP